MADCPKCEEIAKNEGGDQYIFDAKCIDCRVQDAEYALFNAENNLAELRKQQAEGLSGRPGKGE